MLIHQIPVTLSRFPYKNLNDLKYPNSYYIAGVVGSNIDADGYLVPHYDFATTFIDESQTLISVDDSQSFNDIKKNLKQLERLTFSNIKLHEPFKIVESNEYIYKIPENQKKYYTSEEAYDKYVDTVYANSYCKESIDIETYRARLKKIY